MVPFKAFGLGRRFGEDDVPRKMTRASQAISGTFSNKKDEMREGFIEANGCKSERGYPTR